MSKLRKIFIVLFMFCLSSQSFARGFYAGVGTGPEMADFQQRAYITQLSNFNAKDTTHLSATGWFGSLFGGYDWCCNHFYLAGEANVNASSARFYSTNDEYVHSNFSSSTYRILNSYGISVLPGYLWNNATLFYARLGYANGNFKITTSDVSLANIDRRLNGIRFGAGIKQMLTPNLAVRLEYSQINYDSTSFSTFDRQSSTLKETKITPMTAQVEIGLIYHFC